MGVDLLGAAGERGALEALGDLAAQVVRVINALEEEGVLCHALDAKRVVHAAHRCAHPHSFRSYTLELHLYNPTETQRFNGTASTWRGAMHGTQFPNSAALDVVRAAYCCAKPPHSRDCFADIAHQ